MIIESLRDYFLGCSVLDKLRKINVDFLDSDELAYTIDPTPSVRDVKTYVDGSKLKQYNFVIASREFYGDDVAKNIENSGFYEELSDWVEQQSLVGNLPVLTGNKRAQEISVLTSAYLYYATEDRARYQLQLKLIYYEGR